jgi:hypothetical protein
MAEYYLDELEDWKTAIAFYKTEVEAFTTRLEAVISRNSIPHIAEKVETFLSALGKSADAFYKIQIEIEQQETMLGGDHKPVPDEQISDQMEKRQLLLRHNMHAAEKTYLDTKFGCYDFLAGVLKK